MFKSCDQAIIIRFYLKIMIDRPRRTPKLKSPPVLFVTPINKKKHKNSTNGKKNSKCKKIAK